jgi:hypothetical protein
MIKKADRDAILAMLEDPMVRYKETLVRLVNALPCEAVTEVPVEEEKPVGPNYPAHEERAWNEAWEKKCRRERGVAPEPDFAAMAEEIWRKRWAHGPADNGKASFVVACVDVLRANAHRFAAPAPAVVRDEAWWTETMLKLWPSIGDGVDAFERVLRARFAAAPAPAVVREYSDLDAAKMQIGTALVNAQACRELWNNKQDHSLTFREGLNAVVSACVHATENIDRLIRTFAAESAFDVEALIDKCSRRWSTAASWPDLIRAVAREMGLGKGGA